MRKADLKTLIPPLINTLQPLNKPGLWDLHVKQANRTKQYGHFLLELKPIELEF